MLSQMFRQSLRWVWVATIALGGVSCMQGASTGDGGSDRDFLSCDTGEDCPAAMSCICDVCYYACDGANPCSQGICESVERLDDPNCLVDPLAAISVCLDECSSTADCEFGVCIGERCVPEPEIGPSDGEDVDRSDVAMIDDGLTERDSDSDGSQNDVQAGDTILSQDAVQRSCRIESSQPVGQLTADFEAEPDCSCTSDNPTCHSLFRAQVVGIVGNVVTLSGQKASLNSGPPEPTAPVTVRMLVADGTTPACTDLDIFVERSRMVWSAEATFTVQGNIWPTEQDFNAAQPGSEIYLFLASGSGAGAPDARIYFQPQVLRFRKVCD
jgi:hypothetical protein